MRGTKRIIVLLAAVAALAAGCKDSAYEISEGVEVPRFTVAMLGGGETDIEELRGTTVLITFWASWCPDCQQEMRRVEKDIIERFAGRKFLFLPISRGEQAETVKAWLERNGYGFDTGLDPDASTFRLFAESGIPRNILVDPQGTIVSTDAGDDGVSFDLLLERIAATLDKAERE